jgi:predicted ATP-grasp superfamily ATP-dependent carboligase
VTRVLLTSGQERSVLAACRSLAAAGHEVAVAADVSPAATHWSRFCTARHMLPDARSAPDAFVEGLVEILRATPHDVLLPGNEAALLVISSRRAQLEPYVALGLPPHEVVMAATDKVALDGASHRAGLGVPDTAVCETREEGLEVAGRLGLPLILKPRRTVFEADGSMHHRGGRFIGSLDELEQALPAFGRPYLLQPVVEGTVLSAAGVLTDDGLLSFSLARYLRTWPPEAGNAAFAETITVSDDLRDRIRALLDALGWRGLFELELLHTQEGENLAIDLNPRLYGSLALANRAGAPHAAIFAGALLGRQTAPVTARPGVLYRWEDSELRNAVWAARHGRWRAAAAIVRPRRDVAHAHLHLSDPGPLAARLLRLARQWSAR